MMWDQPVDDPLFCEVSRGIATLTPVSHLDCETTPPFSTSSALPNFRASSLAKGIARPHFKDCYRDGPTGGTSLAIC
jgi:hypothetical protein